MTDPAAAPLSSKIAAVSCSSQPRSHSHDSLNKPLAIEFEDSEFYKDVLPAVKEELEKANNVQQPSGVGYSS